MRSSIYKAENNLIHRHSRVIAITSGKGGVGKTNITVNLAMALSSAGFKVVIFDADLGLSNAEVLLGLNPRHTVYDFLYYDVPLEQVLTDAPNNVKIISGGCGLLELANLSSEAIKHLQRSLTGFDLDADFVLVDTGAGINKSVLAFLAAAQDVLVVVTPEPTSITDAYGLIKVLYRYKVHREINLLINKAVNEQEADSTFRKLQLTAQRFLPELNLQYIGWLPNDDTVVKAVKDQRPFVLYYPDSKPSNAVKAVADRLAGTKENLHKKSGGISSFFGRLTRLFS
ncbi:MinD/ParA family protein [Desulfofalx alkaliphila]|uniref:MinD/ParA family protein n=1 Tax=Desulfofalx alkaliphila TaxID=105483 RepID=UPI0006897CB6|nr:MinD/ParA family protein [Desulfofalx alkaliphila]